MEPSLQDGIDFVFHMAWGVHDGNAILSKYEITDAERIKLSLRTDLDTLVNYGYARRNIIKAKFPELTRDGREFYAVNTHATAFATDDTKQKHINKYLETLENIQGNGDYFVAGGDLNSVPPGSVTDFCESDKCDGVELMKITKIMKLIRDHILNTLKVSLIFWFRFTTLSTR